MRMAASCPCSQDETAGQRVTRAADIFDRHIERSRYSREMAAGSSSHQRLSATPPECRALRLTPRAKLGTIGLTQVLAAELGPKGTRVKRRLARPHRYAAGSDHDQHPEALTYIEGVHALKRLASLDEIARSVLYLASDASSFTSVAAILVDGGVSINRT
jgi:Enoyl-(Acyl carrier protein) reductase